MLKLESTTGPRRESDWKRSTITGLSSIERWKCSCERMMNVLKPTLLTVPIGFKSARDTQA